MSELFNDTCIVLYNSVLCVTVKLRICIKSAVKAANGVIGHILCERSVISQANNTPFKDNLLHIFTGYLPSKKLEPEILLTYIIKCKI